MKFTKEFMGVCLCMIMCLITIICLMTGGGWLLTLIFPIPIGVGIVIFTIIYTISSGVAFWAFVSTDTQEVNKVDL